MNPADGFVEFVRIVDAGSVSEAARQLGVPRPTLSRRLGELEASLGVRLLHRRTRSMSLTQAGQALLPRARQVVESAHAAREAVARVDDVPRGRLRVSVPPDTQMGACFAAFLAKWPEVQLEVLAASRLVDLAAEGFDVALRAGPIGDDRLVARTLGVTNTFCVAAPDFLDRFGRPGVPQAVTELPCVVHLNTDGSPKRSWPLRDGGRVLVTPAMASNDLNLLLELALAGHGLALLPEPISAPHVASGRLEPVLVDAIGAGAHFRLVYVERAFLEPKVRAFVDHVVDWLARTPVLGMAPPSSERASV